MRVLEMLSAAFIKTFGITQPAATAERRAAWFIAGMMAITLGVVAAAGFAFYTALHR